jgi:hypothetical protein
MISTASWTERFGSLLRSLGPVTAPDLRRPRIGLLNRKLVAIAYLPADDDRQVGGRR